MGDRDHLPEVRVAVTVFATVRAVDERDGAFIATIAVRQALAGDVLNTMPIEVQAGFAKGDVPVRVFDVMDTGMAAGNGYLWPAPDS